MLKGGKGGRSWQRAGEAGRKALAEGREFISNHPKTLFPVVPNLRAVSPVEGRCAGRSEDAANECVLFSFCARPWDYEDLPAFLANVY